MFQSHYHIFFSNYTVLTVYHPLKQAYHASQSNFLTIVKHSGLFSEPKCCGGQGYHEVSFQTFVFLTLGNNMSFF